MNTITLKQRGIVTLPKKLRQTLGLEEGQVFLVTEKNGKIVLEPQRNTFDSAIAKAIKEGIDDIKAGRFIEFSTTKEFHKKLVTYEN